MEILPTILVFAVGLVLGATVLALLVGSRESNYMAQLYVGPRSNPEDTGSGLGGCLVLALLITVTVLLFAFSK